MIFSYIIGKRKRNLDHMTYDDDHYIINDVMTYDDDHYQIILHQHLTKKQSLINFHDKKLINSFHQL